MFTYCCPTHRPSFTRGEATPGFLRSHWKDIAKIVVGVAGLALLGMGIAGLASKAGSVLSKMTTGRAVCMIIGGVFFSVVGAIGTNSFVRGANSAWTIARLRTQKEAEAAKEVVTIGSAAEPLDEDQIKGFLSIERAARITQTLGEPGALVIYGNGKVNFLDDPGIDYINPKKLILVGAQIINGPHNGAGLDDALAYKGEWLSSAFRDGNPSVGRTFVKQIRVASVEEALKHTPPSRGWGKGRYHVVYVVVQPQASTV